MGAVLIRDDEGVRWLPLSVAALAVIAVGYFAYQRWWPADTTTQVGVGEVLDRYRDQQASATPPVPTIPATVAATTPATQAAVVTTPGSSPTTAVPSTTEAPPPPAVLPAPGVYRYTTTGREHIDALGGTEHVYPLETTITVTAAGCGVHLRWDLLAERYEEWNLCLGADGTTIELQPEAVQFHEFYGQARTDAVACDQVVQVSPPPGPGTTVARTCTLADEPWFPVWTAVSSSELTVESAAVPVGVFEATIEIDDDEYWEHSKQTWALGPDGLPIVIGFEMSSRNPSPLGGTVYTESIQATLVSLTPLS